MNYFGQQSTKISAQMENQRPENEPRVKLEPKGGVGAYIGKIWSAILQNMAKKPP